MPTYTFLGQTPDDGTYEVGTGPFKDLPAGTYEGNFYGNDPRLGIIQSGQPRYSLPVSPEDASSSGNTFQVGTGPQPGLPAGRFLPDEVQSFLRDQQRAKVAADRDAAAAARIPVSPTPIVGSEVPAQTTLPNPITPVAVPSFVPATGIPNFGGNNLLATGASGIPGIVSPLQSLLTTPSTVPATGSSVPNISSSFPSQSVFSQLFPSVPNIVPDISQTVPATAAHGGPILASDYLPRYEDGGEAEKALRSEILTELMEFLVEGGSWTPEEFYKEFWDMPTPKLKYELEVQRRWPLPPKGEPYVPPWEGAIPLPEEGPTELDAFDRSLDMRDLGRSIEDEIPGALINPERGMGIVNPLRSYQGPYVDPDLPEPVRRSIEQGGFLGPEAAHGGPILASEYLNAGGPVQYFSNGGGSLSESTAEAEASAALGNIAPGIGPIDVESAPPLDLDDPEDPLTTPRIGPFSILDAIRTAATIAVPALTPINAAITAFQAINALNQGKNPGGLIGQGIASLGKVGVDVPGFLEGTLDIETPQNQAQEGSVFSPAFGVLEGGK